MNVSVYKRMLEEVINGKSLPFIGLEASRHLQAPIVVTDANHRVLIYQDVTGEGPFLNTYFTEEEKAIFAEKYRILPLTRANSEKPLGYFFVLKQRGLSIEENEFLDICRQLAILVMLQDSRVLAVEQKYKDEFITDILYNNIESRQILIERARYWGWDFTVPYRAAVIKTEAAQFDRLLPLIDLFADSSAHQVISVDRKEEVVLFWPLPANRQKQEKELMEGMLSKLKEFVEERLGTQIAIGVGQPVEGTELFKSYQEAKTSLQLKLLMKEAGQAGFFEDLGIMRLLFTLGDYKLQSFVWETMKPMFEVDTETKEELLDTLDLYFQNNEDIAKTAEQLFVHANTLRYRINKIENLLGVNLKNVEDKINLYSAVKLNKIISKRQEG